MFDAVFWRYQVRNPAEGFEWDFSTVSVNVKASHYNVLQHPVHAHIHNSFAITMPTFHATQLTKFFQHISAKSLQQQRSGRG
jgi:hypothetical protein